MKKIMVMMAAAAIAGIAQAAAVQWNSGTYSNGFTGPDGENLKGSTAYTAICYFYSDAAGSNLLGSDTMASANAMTGAYTKTYSGYDFAANQTYYTKLVISSDAKVRESEIGSFTMPLNGNTSINFTTGAGFASSGSQWSASGWQNVPEPTSGLLLLMGVAGLALRRRRA